MSARIICLILFFWTREISCSDGFTINKCCPEGEKLDFNLTCTAISLDDYDEFSNSSIDSFDWFPMGSIVNASTLKIHPNDTEKYFDILRNEYEVSAGIKPNCGGQYGMEVAHFKIDLVELFHFILYDDNTFKIHISKLNSLHDRERDYTEFQKADERVDKSEIEMDLVKDKLRTFPLDDACVDMGYHQFFFLIYCPCKHAICIRKCCGDGEFLNETSYSCEKITDTSLDIKNWRPQTEGIIDKYYLLTDAMPQCNNVLMLKKPVIDDRDTCSTTSHKESDNNFTILANGSVKIKKYKRPYHPENYCGEVTWHENGVINEQNLVICMSGKQTRNQNVQPIRFLLYGILLILGGVCLLITVTVSFYLPELRRRMHNKIALSHNFSLMVAYFAAGIVQLSPNLGDNSCIVLGITIQFTFLGSFFWLNVMCIDISMTFSATRSVGGGSTSGESKKFIYYSIYSWGITTAISAVTIIMEVLPKVPYAYLRPGLKCYCGFDTDTSAVLLYFYGPMAFILTLNLILFIFTTVKIVTIQRQTAILHKTESKATGGASYQTDKQRLILYAKLFLLMGLSWITEIASWAIGGPDYYWYLSDVINLLRAVFIFILFICKKPVLMNLKKRLNGESLGISSSNKSESTKMQDSLRLTHSARFRASANTSRKQLPRASNLSTKKHSVGDASLKNVNNLMETRI